MIGSWRRWKGYFSNNAVSAQQVEEEIEDKRAITSDALELCGALERILSDAVVDHLWAYIPKDEKGWCKIKKEHVVKCWLNLLDSNYNEEWNKTIKQTVRSNVESYLIKNGYLDEGSNQ